MKRLLFICLVCASCSPYLTATHNGETIRLKYYGDEICDTMVMDNGWIITDIKIVENGK